MNQQSVFLLLGANLGEREATLAKAMDLISERIAPVTLQSHLYETAPWGVTDQPAFLNQVISIKTVLTPEELLSQTLEIEKQLGRERRLRWGARVIDIDMLYYSDLILDTENLHLPHPRLHQRRFTLVPLVEIAPDFVHPVLHKTNQELLNECTDDSQVSVFE
ncbi:2-amino-4-hydroxy-6-hydroxymethyldihydropteridine diphosphokinase [Runella sp. CRIBMP]|uniref:2-amino-4-hydroxy-6- hydroxymethyldihydropteridine diphosphokinase n=1 Tax=Runella sp. CRIBMP TaxID=2683261 RepID=UPI00141361A9|nr:2-amino-4-hydroxy-6-hydroxymethyldihydropteridine diphosphokinase [Runella sp. CRIBMP]NBB21229.1 2-amino-4-hydroxy-6-hydroxymethyldihydropteridine diphosphokinase [Runella sp. CRIBMP]